MGLLDKLLLIQVNNHLLRMYEVVGTKYMGTLL